MSFLRFWLLWFFAAESLPEISPIRCGWPVSPSDFPDSASDVLSLHKFMYYIWMQILGLNLGPKFVGQAPCDLNPCYYIFLFYCNEDRRSHLSPLHTGLPILHYQGQQTPKHSPSALVLIVFALPQNNLLNYTFYSYLPNKDKNLMSYSRHK